MSMFKKLKGIFIIEEEGMKSSGTVSSDSSSEDTAATVKSPKEASPGSSSGTELPSEGPDNKFIDLLLKAIESKNMDGFDYLEFKQSLQSLVKLETLEEKRFQSAFAMASTMGLTKDKLFKSAQHYANVLHDEQKKFEEAFQKQKKAQIDEKESRMKTLQNQIREKQELLEQIQKEIADSEKQLSGIEDQVDKSLSKIESTHDKFYASYNLVLGQIKDDISKIEKYI